MQAAFPTSRDCIKATHVMRRPPHTREPHEYMVWSVCRSGSLSRCSLASRTTPNGPVPESPGCALESLRAGKTVFIKMIPHAPSAHIARR
jgi:hypothetical protein